MPTEFLLQLTMSSLKGIFSLYEQYIDARKHLTRDLKGTASTGEFTRAILTALETVKVEEVD